MQLLCLLAAALLLGEAGFVIANDHGSYDSSDFYRMVEDVGKGVNYYQLLGVDETVPTSDLRKAFRKASLAWHPDKNPSPEASTRFQQIVFAYDVLSNEDKKRIYDSYRKEGIPWQENYYGKYAHRYGAPDHDVRWVLFWLVTVVTVVHYLYKLHRYSYIMSMIKQTDRYKHSKRRLTQQQGASGKKGKGKGKGKRKGEEQEEEESEGDAEPEIRLMGLSRPGWRDLIVVRLVKVPFDILYMVFCLLRYIFWYKMLGRTPPPVDHKKLIKEKLGFNEEEWKTYKRQWKEKQQVMLRYRKR